MAVTMGQSASEGSPVISDGKVFTAEPMGVAKGTVNVRGPFTELTVTVVVGATGGTAAGVDEAGADAGSVTGDATMTLLVVVLAGGDAVVVMPPPPPPQALRARDAAMATETTDFDVFIFGRFFDKKEETK